MHNNGENSAAQRFQQIQKLAHVSISIPKSTLIKFFIIVLILILFVPRLCRTLLPLVPCFRRKERDDELSLSQQFEIEQNQKRLLIPDQDEEEEDFGNEPTLSYAGSMPEF